MRFDWVWAVVGQSLIAGLELLADDTFAETHRDEYRRFCRRLIEASVAKKSRAFDSWMKTEREHGYVRLLPNASQLHGAGRKHAIERAKRYYRLLLWSAYQMMGRCYGALMLVVWLDFCRDQELRPTTVEKQLFRLMHAPQFYLAGLPLAFFPAGQLRWIAGPLLDCWNREQFESEAYDALSTLLGLYGITAATRREVDRKVKADQRAGKSVRRDKRVGDRGGRVTKSGRRVEGDLRTGEAVPSDGNDLSTDSESPGEVPDRVVLDDPAFVDLPEDFPLYETMVCRQCAGPLSPEGLPQLVGKWAILDVQCTYCGNSLTIRVDPEQFKR